MMTEKINTHLANDLEQSAVMLDSREFDAVQLDNCASMMRYAATVIRQALANDALDKMAENARELGLSYEQPAQQEPEYIVQSNGRVSPLLTHTMNKRVKSNVKQVIELYDSPDEPAPAQEPVTTDEFSEGWKAARQFYTTPQPPAQEPDPDELTIAYMSGLYEGKKIGAKEEREACAKVCDKGVDTEHPTVKSHIMKNFGASSLLASAIRARGSK